MRTTLLLIVLSGATAANAAPVQSLIARLCVTFTPPLGNLMKFKEKLEQFVAGPLTQYAPPPSRDDLLSSLRQAREEGDTMLAMLETHTRQNHELTRENQELAGEHHRLRLLAVGVQQGLAQQEALLTERALSNHQVRQHLRRLSHGFFSRVTQLTDQIAELERGIEHLGKEAARIEETGRAQGLRMDRLDKLLGRHQLYVAPSLFWSHAPTLGGGLTYGFGLDGQYNFMEHVGLFAGGQGTLANASKPGSLTLGDAKAQWHEFNLHVGGVVNFLTASSPVSVQLGSGVAVGMAGLRYFPPGSDHDDLGASRELLSGINVSFLTRAELGVTTPHAFVEPYVTFEMSLPFQDWTYQDAEVAVSLGRMLWRVGVGLRFRTLLAGDLSR